MYPDVCDPQTQKCKPDPDDEYPHCGHMPIIPECFNNGGCENEESCECWVCVCSEECCGDKDCPSETPTCSDGSCVCMDSCCQDSHCNDACEECKKGSCSYIEGGCCSEEYRCDECQICKNHRCIRDEDECGHEGNTEDEDQEQEDNDNADDVEEEEEGQEDDENEDDGHGCGNMPIIPECFNDEGCGKGESCICWHCE